MSLGVVMLDVLRVGGGFSEKRLNDALRDSLGTDGAPKCDQTPDLWQRLELASELESDLRDSMD